MPTYASSSPLSRTPRPEANSKVTISTRLATLPLQRQHINLYVIDICVKSNVQQVSKEEFFLAKMALQKVFVGFELNLPQRPLPTFASPGLTRISVILKAPKKHLHGTATLPHPTSPWTACSFLFRDKYIQQLQDMALPIGPVRAAHRLFDWSTIVPGIMACDSEAQSPRHQINLHMHLLKVQPKRLVYELSQKHSPAVLPHKILYCVPC